MAPGMIAIRQHARAVQIISFMILSYACMGPASAQDLVHVAIPQRGTWETSTADLGEKAGIFAKHGIKVESLYTSGGGETMQALISGSVDIAASTGAAATFAAYVKGAPVRPVATSVTGAREIFWYVKADSPIKTLKDAAGKTMAFSATGSSSNLATLKLIKMSGADIKPVATGTPVATFTQTMTGQVDIGWSAAPFALGALQDHQIRAIANVGDIVEYRDMSARFHLANMNFITNKADVLKRFLTAYSETLDWMYKGDDAVRVFSELYKVKEAEVRQTRDEFYTRQSLDIRRIGGLDHAMEDAVAYKFIPQALTKAQIDDLFKYHVK